MNNENNYYNQQLNYNSTITPHGAIEKNNEVPIKKVIKTMLIAQLISYGIVALFGGLVNAVSMFLLSDYANDSMSSLSTVISTVVAWLSSLIPNIIIFFMGYRCYKQIKGAVIFFFSYKVGDAVASIISNILLAAGNVIMMNFETNITVATGALVYTSSILMMILSVVCSLLLLKKLNKYTVLNESTNVNLQNDLKNNNFKTAAALLIASHLLRNIVSKVVSLLRMEVYEKNGYINPETAISEEFEYFNWASTAISGLINVAVALIVILGLGYLCYKTVYGTAKFYVAANLGTVIAGTLSSLISSDILLLVFNVSTFVSSIVSTVVNIVVIILAALFSVIILKKIEDKESFHEQQPEFNAFEQAD